MFEFIEKWALQRFLKRVSENIPMGQDRLLEIWKEHKEEIFEKVAAVIEKTIKNIIKKALEKQGIKLFDNENN